jgi:hypothetical protein
MLGESVNVALAFLQGRTSSEPEGAAPQGRLIFFGALLVAGHTNSFLGAREHAELPGAGALRGRRCRITK